MAKLVVLALVIGGLFFSPCARAEKSLAGNRAPQTPAIKPANECDLAAASPLDKDRPTGIPGVSFYRVDPKIAVPACEAAAKITPDSPRIIFELGRAYAAAKNYEAAREQYAKADQTGYAPASNNLGVLYLEAWGVPRDLPKGMHLLEKAARSGMGLASASLDHIYQGRLNQIDPPLLRQLMQKSAESGDVDAMYALGNYLTDGVGGPSDPAGARSWYEKAANAGDARAMYALGRLYADGIGGAKDDAQARRWTTRAAAAGVPNAMNDLGYFYATGYGGSRDDAQARSWIDKAAEAGSVVAMQNLGWRYANGQGITRDYAIAARWYERAARAGSVAAMKELAGLYAGGLGVARDSQAAFHWYQKAALSNDAEAMNKLGQLDAEGDGRTRHFSEARYWFERASKAGNADAARNLAILGDLGADVARDPGEALHGLGKSTVSYQPVATRSGNSVAARKLAAAGKLLGELGGASLGRGVFVASISQGTRSRCTSACLANTFLP